MNVSFLFAAEEAVPSWNQWLLSFDGRLVAAVLVAALGLWLMFPRPHRYVRRLGGVLALVGFVLLALLVPSAGAEDVRVLFYALAGLTIAAAAGTVTARNPVYSAIWFALTLLGTAGLFLFQGAQFLGVATVVVYAGAIVVTFLFVLMLAQPTGHAYYDRISWGTFPAAIACLAGMALVAVVAYVLAREAGVHERLLASLPELVDDQDAPLLAPADIRHLRLTGRAQGRTVLHLALTGQAPRLSLLDQTRLQELIRKDVLHLPEGKLLLQLSYQPHDQGVLDRQHMARFGGELFSRHLISVEVAGTLLLVALVGAAAIVIQGRDPAAANSGTGGEP